MKKLGIKDSYNSKTVRQTHPDGDLKEDRNLLTMSKMAKFKSQKIPAAAGLLQPELVFTIFTFCDDDEFTSSATD